MKSTFMASLAFLFLVSSALGATNESIYWQLPNDIQVYSSTMLTQQTLTMAQSDYVYVQSSGRYGPIGPAIANVYIDIDGNKVSSDAVTDWSRSTNSQQHSFEAIGAVLLQAGTHTIRLWANPLKGGFYVGGSTNLSVLVRPASEVKQAVLSADTGPISFSTLGINMGSNLPGISLASLDISNLGTPIVSIASSRAYMWSSAGDVLSFIDCSQTRERNDLANYSVNDLYTGAENQAVLSNHFLCSQPIGGMNKLSLIFSEFPWSDQNKEDPVNYRVGAGSRIIGLSGGMKVVGSAPSSTATANRTDWVVIGSSTGGSPVVGTAVRLSTSTVSIPTNHNGVVLFTAKSRVQGDRLDGGGTAYLWIQIDGIPVGSVGVQQLGWPNGDSQRTIVASYLATGNHRLAPGSHTVEVYGRAYGNFKHLAMVNDLPLIWFD